MSDRRMTRDDLHREVAPVVLEHLRRNGYPLHGVDDITGDPTRTLSVTCRGYYYQPVVRVSVRRRDGVWEPVRLREVKR